MLKADVNNHTPPSGIEVKNEWRYTFTQLYAVFPWARKLYVFNIKKLPFAIGVNLHVFHEVYRTQ